MKDPDIYNPYRYYNETGVLSTSPEGRETTTPTGTLDETGYRPTIYTTLSSNFTRTHQPEIETWSR